MGLSIDSRKVKEPPSNAQRRDLYTDKSFSTNLDALLDTKHHKSLDVPITDDKGNLIPMTLKVGDKIFFAKWGGTEVKVDDEDLLIMKESDVLAIIE